MDGPGSLGDRRGGSVIASVIPGLRLRYSVVVVAVVVMLWGGMGAGVFGPLRALTHNNNNNYIHGTCILKFGRSPNFRS